MRPKVTRQGMMPLAFAMLLSVAAGLSLAAEHTRAATASPQGPMATANALNGQGQGSNSIKARPEGSSRPTPQKGGALAKQRSTDEAGTGDGQTKSGGVGSRALIGNDAPDAADQPEMATGVDLKGPPVRFPAGDTPE
jgi:hypothetical protein